MTLRYPPTVDPCANIIYYKCIGPNPIVKDYLSLQGRLQHTYIQLAIQLVHVLRVFQKRR